MCDPNHGKKTTTRSLGWVTIHFLSLPLFYLLGYWHANPTRKKARDKIK